MAARKKKTGITWVGGIFAMPAHVTGEGDPYRPESLLWLGAQGEVLGHTVGKPGELVERACESLRSTIARPLMGRPHAPDRLRVASAELAEVLRAGFPELEVVCAATPEIDEVIAAMREQGKDRAELLQTYRPSAVEPAAIAAFFRAAAALYRARPWEIVPSGESIFSISIEKLGVTAAALSVVGQMGQSLGLIRFASAADFDAFLEAAGELEPGASPSIPRHFALTFERGAELSAALRQEIAEHHWELADASAYPWLVTIEADLVARPPTTEELAIAEAIALALPKVLEEKQALLAAWDGGEPVVRTIVVTTHSGEVEVSLRVPYEVEPSRAGLPHDVLSDLFELGQEGEEIDPEVRQPLQEELAQRFAASPEAKALDDVQWCHLVMDLAAENFNATIATLGARELREILFEIIPTAVSIHASAASGIIEETRAFYAFLGREYALEQAGACLRVLGGDAVKRLEAALSDTSKFGLAKSLLMSGREAGFDIDSKEGLEEWMRVVQSRPLPPSIRLPSRAAPGAPARPQDRHAARAKKNARKAVRKARKKGR